MKVTLSPDVPRGRDDDAADAAADAAPSLCCCEYVNSDGERSHLCQLFCDCAEVDDAFDRLISGRGMPVGRGQKVSNNNMSRAGLGVWTLFTIQ
jgi:hypothetical protein